MKKILVILCIAILNLLVALLILGFIIDFYKIKESYTMMYIYTLSISFAINLIFAALLFIVTFFNIDEKIEWFLNKNNA